MRIAPYTEAVASKIRITLSPARIVENDSPSGKKSPIFSLNIRKLTQAADVIAVSPTPKGKKTVFASAVARLDSARAAILEDCP